MQVFKCIIAFVVIGSSLVTFLAAQVYVAFTPVHTPGLQRIANWEPNIFDVEAEDRTNVERYGKFQMVIDQSRLADFGVNASAQNYASEKHNETVIVRFTENNKDNLTTDFVFECERCYMHGDVSGGKVIARRGDARWRLDFLQVGEQGIVFTNQVPPNWVLESCGEVELEQISGELLRSFGKIYSADLAQDKLTKRRVSRDIVSQLLRLIDMEFGFSQTRADN